MDSYTWKETDKTNVNGGLILAKACAQVPQPDTDGPIQNQSVVVATQEAKVK